MFYDNSNTAFLEIVLVFTALLIPIAPKKEIVGFGITTLTLVSLVYLSILSTDFVIPPHF